MTKNVFYFILLIYVHCKYCFPLKKTREICVVFKSMILLRRKVQACKTNFTCKPSSFSTRVTALTVSAHDFYRGYLPLKNMVARRRLSVADRGRALALLNEGYGVTEVGRRLGVTWSVISRLRDRFIQTGTVQERRRSGRPRVTSRREDRYVVNTTLRDRFLTAPRVRGMLQAATNTNVSVSTIRNRLREGNIRSRRPAVRPRLTQAHRARRLGWARIHSRWIYAQWSNLIFTDESRFNLSTNDGRIRVWRRRGERYADATVREHDRYGGGSVMVWGGINHHQRTPLYRVDGNLTGIRYRDEILRPLVIPALQAIGPNAVLMDDNAPCHRARIVNNFIQAHNVTRMVWPAVSPDMNPIQHVWDILGRRVRENQPPAANRDALFQQLQQEWQQIPQADLRRLLRSMGRRCQACIDANGGHTRY